MLQALVLTAALLLPHWLGGAPDHKAHLEAKVVADGTEISWYGADMSTRIKGEAPDGLILLIDSSYQGVPIGEDAASTIKLPLEPGPHHFILRAAHINPDVLPPQLELGPVQAELTFVVPGTKL